MWSMARIYYFDNQRVLKLAPSLLALIEQYSHDDATRFYYLPQRYGGPHLALYIRSTRAGDLSNVHDGIQQEFQSFFSIHPSAAKISTERSREVEDRLAEMELNSKPPREIAKDNTIVFEDDDQFAQHFGGDHAFALARTFLVGSSRLVLPTLLAAGDSPNSRAFSIVSKMLLSARSLGVWEDNMKYTFMSFRSHAEGFLNAFDKHGMMRSRFDTLFELHSANLSNLYQNLVTTEQTNQECHWTRLFDDTYESAYKLAIGGKLNLPTNFEARATNSSLTRIYGRSRAPMSEFHRRAYADPAVTSFIGTPRFQTRRFMLNLLYDVLLQSGFSPLEKFLFCHLVANTDDLQQSATWRDAF